MNEEKTKHDFAIGSQYDEYEFLVENMAVIQDKGLQVEMYRYSGAIKAIHGNEVLKTWLVFNGDILTSVVHLMKDAIMADHTELQAEKPVQWLGQNFLIKGEIPISLLNRILKTITV